MQGTQSLGNIVEMINKIERYIHERHRVQQILVAMVAHAPNRLLKDYVTPTNEEAHLSIVRHIVDANDFELKPFLLSMVH